jgi:hypothetical protein
VSVCLSVCLSVSVSVSVSVCMAVSVRVTDLTGVCIACIVVCIACIVGNDCDSLGLQRAGVPVQRGLLRPHSLQCFILAALRLPAGDTSCWRQQQSLEKMADSDQLRVMQRSMRDMGVVADIIVFHP